MARHLDTGLTVSPITYVELAPAFNGSRKLLDEFLEGLGVDAAGWEVRDRDAAFAAWARHVNQRRTHRSARRPVADVLIAALAMRCEGLMTRSGADFKLLYPKIRIVNPQRDRG